MTAWLVEFTSRSLCGEDAFWLMIIIGLDKVGANRDPRS